MYLPSYLSMDWYPSSVEPDPALDLAASDELDETAREIAEAHIGLRFLLKYSGCSPEARARLLAAMAALEAIDSDVEAMQEAARKREAE